MAVWGRVCLKMLHAPVFLYYLHCRVLPHSAVWCGRGCSFYQKYLSVLILTHMRIFICVLSSEGISRGELEQRAASAGNHRNDDRRSWGVRFVVLALWVILQALRLSKLVVLTVYTSPWRVNVSYYHMYVLRHSCRVNTGTYFFNLNHRVNDLEVNEIARAQTFKLTVLAYTVRGKRSYWKHWRGVHELQEGLLNRLNSSKVLWYLSYRRS